MDENDTNIFFSSFIFAFFMHQESLRNQFCDIFICFVFSNFFQVSFWYPFFDVALSHTQIILVIVILIYSFSSEQYTACNTLYIHIRYDRRAIHFCCTYIHRKSLSRFPVHHPFSFAI